jgi:hypothetical protein
MLGGCEILQWCLEMDATYLTEVHRTKDQQLLDFLYHVRREQPTRSFLQDFYKERHMDPDMATAVRQGLRLQERRGQHFMWLCVTNKGAGKINDMALTYAKVTDVERKRGLPGDDKAGAGIMCIKPDLWIRLTQNLDKPRGFVNGALAQVVSILAESDAGVTVFVARIANGALVLVHPIRQGQKVFLPCCYGYATTIRRAQGSSLHLGALYFDHCYPPERGYGYVGASRFRSSGGLYFYGRIRRTDWLPVGAAKPEQVTRRSAASLSSDSGRESESGHESEESERTESDYSTTSLALGEDPADFSSDEEAMTEWDDDNYLDREGNLSCDDVGDLLCGHSSDSDS